LQLGSADGLNAMAKKQIVPIDASKITDATRKSGRIRLTEQD
jgi:hypothetical protein